MTTVDSIRGEREPACDSKTSCVCYGGRGWYWWGAALSFSVQKIRSGTQTLGTEHLDTVEICFCYDLIVTLVLS